MNVNNIIEKLRKQPRHGVLPRGRAPRGRVARQISPRQEAPREVEEVLPAETSVDINQQVQQLARQMATEMLAEQDALRSVARMGRTYTPFAPDDVIAKQTEVVTAGLWSDSKASLTTYFTSSTAQTSTQKQYYVDVYQSEPTVSGSVVQYSLAYGHALGSGSDSTGQLEDSPSKAIYSQYRQLLLNPGDSRFTTGDGSTDHIYVINFKRDRMRERLDPGNFELPIRFMSASLPSNATGSVNVSSSVVHSLIDDSSITAGTIGESGKVFNIVSGSINGGVFNTSAPVYYGLAYPDHGVLVLDGNKLDANLNFQTNSGSSSAGSNHYRLFHSISGSAEITNVATSDPYGFQARNSEKITSTHYFVRVKNGEYNFSNNPSYVTGSVGQLSQTDFVGDPKSYITTVGLYNDNRELLAVAKLSKPLLKSFSREALIRVKLDF
jgi:hypothetical protein